MRLAASSPQKLTVPAGKSQLVVADDATRNLFLIVGRTRKTWQIRFRQFGKRSTMTLGYWPDMGLGDARHAANAAMAKVDRGHDPRSTADTINDAFDQYWTARMTSLKHPQQDRSKWDRLIAPVIGHLPLGALSKAVWPQLQAHWVASGNAAGQHGLIRIARHFEAHLLDHDLIDRSFIPRRVQLPPVGSYPVPPVDDVVALLAWCEAHYQGGVGGVRSAYRGGSRTDAITRACALALLALTGVRLSQITGLRWDEIQGDTLVWGADRMKAGRAFRQPVSTAALVWLDRIPPNNRPWCFPNANGSGPTQIDLNRWTQKAGLSWPPHSLRKALGTWAGEAGYSDAVIGLLLAHAPQGVTSLYAKSDRMDERRVALEAWGREVEVKPQLDGLSTNVD
ncbi:tyrosine-type recombinase/integrase [Tateyamaria sp.]|uniref:tyrosine-type recombinase/integrase n=1 Tax=Tateyamaria sp. TaxID=1929288 RepID=UPI00329D0103